MIWYPSPEALGAVRICVHGAFLVSILLTSFDALGRLPTTLMHPPGIMAYLGWKAYDQVITPTGMATLKGIMIASLSAGMIGWNTPFATKLSAVLVLFYQGILGSFGHACAESTVGMYCLAVLSVSPCGDAFSLDRWIHSVRERPGWAYGYPILLMQLLLCWSYFAAGVSKLRVSGLAYFDADTLPSHAVRNSLHNLHDTQFEFGLLLPLVKDLLPLAVAAAVTWEIAFPMAVFVPRMRRFFIITGVMFHIGTWLTMNIIFVNQIAMYSVLLDWPNLIRRWREWRRTPNCGEASGIEIAANNEAR